MNKCALGVPNDPSTTSASDSSISAMQNSDESSGVRSRTKYLKAYTWSAPHISTPLCDGDP